MSLIAVALLAAAVVLLAAAEWPRLAGRVNLERRQPRRGRRKPQLRLVRPDADESDEFARAVERDLASLPTYDPRDSKNRSKKR